MSWTPPIEGNMRCGQIKRPDGSYLNHGQFMIWHPNGQLAVEGEFTEGQRSGRWISYDEAGKKLIEKSYESGNEVVSSPKVPIQPAISQDKIPTSPH